MMLFSHLLLQSKPIRAWLTNGIESIILPPFGFSLSWIIALFPLLLIQPAEMTHRAEKQVARSRCRGWQCRWDGRMTS